MSQSIAPERRASAPVRSALSVSPPSTHEQQHVRSASSSAHFSFKGYFNKLLHPAHASQLSSPPLPSPGPLSPRSSSIPFHTLLQHHKQYSSFLATLEAELRAYGVSMTQAHHSLRRLGATLHGMYRMKAVEDANKRRPANRSGAKFFSPATITATSAGSTLSWLSASFASHTTKAAHIFDTAIQQRLDLLIIPWLEQKRGDSARIDQLIADDTHNWQRYQHYSQKVAELETIKERDRRDGRDHGDKERYERNHLKLESSRVTYQHCHHALLRELATSFEMRFSFLDSLLLELVKAEQSYHTGLHGQLLPIIVKVKEMIKGIGERKAAIETKEEKDADTDDGNDERQNTVMMGTSNPTLSTNGFGSLSLSLPTVSSSSLHAHYQLITKIGAGTYGETMLCTDSADDSVWVMKRLQCYNVRHVNRAMHEAMMMSAVKDCLYVCRVREVFIEEWTNKPAEKQVGEVTTADLDGKEDEVRYDGETDGGEEGVEGSVRSQPKAEPLCTVCIVMEYGIGGDLQRRISIELSRKRQKVPALSSALSPSASPSPNAATSHGTPVTDRLSPRHERSVSYSFNSVNSYKYVSTDEEQLPGSASPSSAPPPAGFPAARVISWMYQLCNGIRSLHSALLLHRDIKVRAHHHCHSHSIDLVRHSHLIAHRHCPLLFALLRVLQPENLFLTSSDDLRLGDYGIMHQLPSATATTSTHIGTPAYMAPECIGREGYGLSADVWSAGCVLYELCTLCTPSFSFRSMDAVMTQVRERGYGEELVGVMRRMLSVEAKERPTAAECADVFKRMMSAELHQKELQ